MMTFPTEWKNKIHVPNHQPDHETSSFEESLNIMINPTKLDHL
jgi:hypothetical protein